MEEIRGLCVHKVGEDSSVGYDRAVQAAEVIYPLDHHLCLCFLYWGCRRRHHRATIQGKPHLFWAHIESCLPSRSFVCNQMHLLNHLSSKCASFSQLSNYSKYIRVVFQCNDPIPWRFVHLWIVVVELVLMLWWNSYPRMIAFGKRIELQIASLHFLWTKINFLPVFDDIVLYTWFKNVFFMLSIYYENRQSASVLLPVILWTSLIALVQVLHSERLSILFILSCFGIMH